MFHKIQTKLSLICCLVTTLLVLIIILCCLRVSEKNMYGQETALFFLKAKAVSSTLQASEPVDIHWYMRNFDADKNMLYLETNGIPATLPALTLSEQEYSLIEEIKTYAEQKNSGRENPSQQYFAYTKDSRRFLVMYGRLLEKEQKLTYIFLYNLEDFCRNVQVQRRRFLAIWLFSIFILYLFSHIFTAHVLQPVIQNDERQRHFAASASHELRSPLAVFKTGLSILKSEPEPRKTARIFSLMEHEMARMERLLQDLLCLSKMENADLPFTFEQTNLADLLFAVYEKYAVIAKDKDLSLSFPEVSTPGTSGGSYECCCDRQRIEQAVIILLDNAFSYTPPGGSITLNLYSSHKKYYIQVIDTGTGICDSDKEKIFDRFYQADSSRSRKEHFGLGLAIAKEICIGHGGAVFVSDTKGGGSTFTIKLPVRK